MEVINIGLSVKSDFWLSLNDLPTALEFYQAENWN